MCVDLWGLCEDGSRARLVSVSVCDTMCVDLWGLCEDSPRARLVSLCVTQCV